jgi:Mg/Co/Ni transporter MgtE
VPGPRISAVCPKAVARIDPGGMGIDAMPVDVLDFHEALSAALSAGGDDALASVLKEARAADIAQSFQILSDEDRSRIIFALPPATAAEVVTYLDEAVRGAVVEELDTESLTEIVSELAPDDAADVLAELTEREAEQILDKLGDVQAGQIEELLEFDESPWSRSAPPRSMKTSTKSTSWMRTGVCSARCHFVSS